MQIFSFDCGDLEDCYDQKKNESIIHDLLAQMDEYKTDDELFAFDGAREEELKDRTYSELVTPKTKISSNSNFEDFLLDNYQLEKGELQQLTPSNFDKIELLDNGLTWAYKTRFQTKGHRLVFCIARNEIGDSISTKVITPSEIERGRPYQVNMINQRERDIEIVEGDDINVQFAFNNILFNKNDYSLLTKNSVDNSESCSLGSKYLTLNTNSNFKYTHLLQLKFMNITKNCNYNYTLGLKVNQHPHFLDSPLLKPKNPSINYNLNVLAPIKPFFLDKSMNQTTSINDKSSNDTVFITTTDIRVKSDQTIVLNCLAIGRPKPSIVWLKYSQFLNTSDEKYVLSEGALKIMRTHPIDSGRYECAVSNRFGAINRSFNVKVEATRDKRQKKIIYIVSITLSIVTLLFLLALILYYVQRMENFKLKVRFFCEVKLKNINPS
jgi:hypothetical protein